MGICLLIFRGRNGILTGIFILKASGENDLLGRMKTE
jgi:hypothetical protein